MEAVIEASITDNDYLVTPMKKRRKSKENTPIVDDEVKRSARLRRDDNDILVQLDVEPRRRKGEAKKTVRFSIVGDLKKSIINGELSQNMEMDEVELISSSLLVELGTGFCAVSPKELTEEDLQVEVPK